MYVYQAFMKDCTIDAFDTTKYIQEPEEYSIGYFTSKKKANEAIKKNINDEIDREFRISNGNIIHEYFPTGDDRIKCCRIEIPKFIFWKEGRIEQILVK